MEMLRLLIPFILLNFNPIHCSIQNLSNPIVPILIANTSIISDKHTFVSYLNVTELKEMQNNLNLQLNFIIQSKNLSSMTDKLIKQCQALYLQNRHLLNAIYPKLRTKRGLINLGGKISNWLFGTLDSDDGERINNVLNYLKKNDHIIEGKINSQISLTKEFMNNTYENLLHIKTNINITMNLINSFRHEINEINMLHLIINSLNSLRNQLEQIVDAITFANLNKIHSAFLSLENLDSIVLKLKSIYPSEQLVNFKNQHSYYRFFGIELLFEPERIIFLIHCPIISSTRFQTYFIYPIPLQNRIISSPKPYLILNEEKRLYQYEEEPCEEIEKTSYCKNHLRSDQECIVDIITENKPTTCNTIRVNIQNAIIKRVTTNNILFTTPNQSVITESCSVIKHHTLAPGSYLLTLSNQCQVNINEEKFTTSNNDILPARLIQLPALDVSSLHQHPFTIGLRDMNLEVMKQIAAKVNAQHTIHLPEETSNGPSVPTWTIVLCCVLVCLLIGIGVKLYYQMCYPLSIFHREIQKKTEVNDQPNPSLAP